MSSSGVVDGRDGGDGLALDDDVIRDDDDDDDDDDDSDAVKSSSTTTRDGDGGDGFVDSRAVASTSMMGKSGRDVARDGAVTAVVVVVGGALARKAWAWARGDAAGRGHPGPGRDAGFHRAHRKCNRCGVRGKRVNVKCSRCKRCWYCSQTCKKAAWAMEICECC
tara:strand:- start:72577 stop:73071 length:495 start_codon:yes stop_codon:yes gene_type:complete